MVGLKLKKDVYANVLNLGGVMALTYTGMCIHVNGERGRKREAKESKLEDTWHRSTSSKKKNVA